MVVRAASAINQMARALMRESPQESCRLGPTARRRARPRWRAMRESPQGRAWLRAKLRASVVSPHTRPRALGQLLRQRLPPTAYRQNNT